MKVSPPYLDEPDGGGDSRDAPGGGGGDVVRLRPKARAQEFEDVGSRRHRCSKIFRGRLSSEVYLRYLEGTRRADGFPIGGGEKEGLG